MARLAPPIRSLLDCPDAERRLGPFLLVEQLGRGGFAPVWLAKEVYGITELRTAAVKLFSLDAPGGPESWGSEANAPGQRTPPSAAVRARIVEEARALCQVEHPNVVRFYSLPIDEARGVMGLAMEYVAGMALDKRIAGKGHLAVADTLAIGVAVASALSAVHRAGLVHRDVKPGNVIDAAGVYKLIDFGIAAADALPKKAPSRPRIVYLDDLPLEISETKLSNIEGATTRTTVNDESSSASLGVRCGTVGYIDPVCVSSGVPATFASDLYALGATLFECLTGMVPAAAAAAEGKGLRGDVLDGRAPPPPLLEIAPAAPPSLARLVDGLLAPVRTGRPTSAELVAIRLEQIKNELAGLKRSLPPESVGPFRGLGRFEKDDRDVYFGRSSEVAAALEMLRSRGVVALVGPSGSGKSSLARAGVLPAVAEGALGGWPKRWDTVVIEPGQDPRASVSAALAPFVPSADAMAPEAVVVALAERVQTSGAGVLILVDQLEELATLASGESQAWTVGLLARLGEQAIPGVRAVVAARRDLLDPLLSLGELGRAMVRGLVLIEPITELTWGDVLEQALGAYGYSLEDDALKQELLRELEATASAMPLVQFALTQLWNNRDTGRKKVTREGLIAIGGIAGALERHAEARLAELVRRRPAAQFAAKSVLLALTTPQGTRATRSMKDLLRASGEIGEEVIEAFERARLIVPGPHGVTLAHEALLTQWGKLRGWVAEAREDRLLADELERDAEKWGADPDAVPLWPRRRIAFAEELRRRGFVQVSPAAVAFLRRSRWAERRVRWSLIGLSAVAAFSLLVTIAFYGMAMHEREEASRIAYNKERVNREYAEQQTQRIQDAQSMIEQLLKDLDSSSTKEAVIELQRQIRSESESPEPSSKPVLASVAPPRLTVVGPTPSQSTAAPRPTVAPAASSAPTPGIKPLTTWD